MRHFRFSRVPPCRSRFVQYGIRVRLAECHANRPSMPRSYTLWCRDSMAFSLFARAAVPLTICAEWELHPCRPPSAGPPQFVDRTPWGGAIMRHFRFSRVLPCRSPFVQSGICICRAECRTCSPSLRASSASGKPPPCTSFPLAEVALPAVDRGEAAHIVQPGSCQHGAGGGERQPRFSNLRQPRPPNPWLRLHRRTLCRLCRGARRSAPVSSVVYT